MNQCPLLLHDYIKDIDIFILHKIFQIVDHFVIWKQEKIHARFGVAFRNSS